MWMHFKWSLFIGVFLSLSCLVQAQEEVTNAFDDLKRQGAVVEEKSSERKQCCGRIRFPVISVLRKTECMTFA